MVLRLRSNFGGICNPCLIAWRLNCHLNVSMILTQVWDLVIVGAGIAGSALAAIQAKV